MAQCITCGTELHPERAVKYGYCMAPACQQQNARGLTMVAIGMNKAADELMVLDERTKEDLASGRYRDQRRGYFGQLPPTARPAAPSAARAAASGRKPAQQKVPSPRPAERLPWTPRQERLARLYNEQGLRPDDIARKLGVSTWLATQITLAARSRRAR